MTATVIRLPTAARRQVKQSSIRAVRQFKADNPWPGEYKMPYQRDGDAIVGQADGSTEMMILLALMKSLPAEQQQMVRDSLYRVQFGVGDAVSLRATILIDSIKSDPA